VFGDSIERIEVERLANMIAGKVFDTGVDYQLVFARRPRLLRRQSPLRFLPLNINATGNIPTRASDLDHPLEQWVVH
jgi:hypothetical protein